MARMGLFSLTLLVCMTTVINRSDGYTLKEDGPVVQTQYGPVQGMYVEEGVVFFGLPFSAPPTGDLRWKPPQPFGPPWAPATYNATIPRPGCLQPGCKPGKPDPHYKCPRGRNISEDCLYLNVFAPRTALDAAITKLPVMFWLYGGEYFSGSGSSIIYDSRILANKTNTIVVTTNYRLGALGFLVTSEGKDAATGNYGILDQIAALTWVRENIGNFGGDKNQVTAFGQSAGSASIGVHLASNRTSDLFQKAIMMSVPFGISFRAHWEAVALGNHFADLLNCSHGDMKCLRSAETKDILKVERECKTYNVNPLNLLEMFIPWGPVVDGDIIQEQIVDSFAKGHLQRKPFIIGTVLEEARLYIYGNWGTPMTRSLYRAVMLGIFREKALSVLREYPTTSSDDQRDNLSGAATDFLLACPTRKAIRGAVAAGNSNVWLYVFDHVWSFKGLWTERTEDCIGHVCHGEDLPFMFQSVLLVGINMTADEQIMADSIAYHYGNFAHTGDPNKPSRHGNNAATAGGGVLSWPKYSEEGGFTNLNISTPRNNLVQEYKKDRCDFWDRLNDYP